jgi:hypothetical protein
LFPVELRLEGGEAELLAAAAGGSGVMLATGTGGVGASSGVVGSGATGSVALAGVPAGACFGVLEPPFSATAIAVPASRIPPPSNANAPRRLRPGSTSSTFERAAAPERRAETKVSERGGVTASGEAKEGAGVSSCTSECER